jgi:hypothetical protein
VSGNRGAALREERQPTRERGETTRGRGSISEDVRSRPEGRGSISEGVGSLPEGAGRYPRDSIRGVIECVVEDNLAPAIEALENTARETPRDLERQWRERLAQRGGAL